MFDYERFENHVVQQMETIYHKWIREHNDLYIFSLDCPRGADSIGVIANTMRYLEEQAKAEPEDYWYYKYCEEEWKLFETFEVLSEYMKKHLDDNSKLFTIHETHEYSEAFYNHCDKIIERCQNALIRFRKSINQSQSNILLVFNIREYFDNEEKISIFRELNSENACKEYMEHIGEFA